MNDEERDALIEALRTTLYNGGTNPLVVLRAARNIVDRIPQRYQVDIEGELGEAMRKRPEPARYVQNTMTDEEMKKLFNLDGPDRDPE